EVYHLAKDDVSAEGLSGVREVNIRGRYRGRNQASDGRPTLRRHDSCPASDGQRRHDRAYRWTTNARGHFEVIMERIIIAGLIFLLAFEGNAQAGEKKKKEVPLSPLEVFLESARQAPPSSPPDGGSLFSPANPNLFLF